MDYDKEEAIDILGRLRNEIDQRSTYNGRKEAAEFLFRALVNAAHDAGLEAGMDLGSVMIWSGERKAVFMFKSGEIHSAKNLDGPSAPVPGIEYDPVNKSYRGTELDAFRVPVPGLPVFRRSAVAVLAERASVVLKS